METGADQYTVMVDSWISPGGIVAIQGGDGKFYVRGELYKYDEDGDITGPADWEERYTVPRGLWRNQDTNHAPTATGLLCVDGVWIVCCTDAIYLTTDFGEDMEDWALVVAGKPQVINQYHTVSVMPSVVASSPPAASLLPFDQESPIRTPITADTYTGTPYYIGNVQFKNYFYVETVGTTKYVRCYYFELTEAGTIQIQAGSCTCFEFKLPSGTEMSDVFSMYKDGTPSAVTTKTYVNEAVSNPSAGYGGFLSLVQDVERDTLFVFYMSPVLRSIPNYNTGLPSALLPQLRIMAVVKGKPYGATLTLHGGDYSYALGNSTYVGISADGNTLYFGVSRSRSDGGGAWYWHDIRSITLDEIKQAGVSDVLNTRYVQSLPETQDYYTFNTQMALRSALLSLCPNVAGLQGMTGPTSAELPYVDVSYVQPASEDTYPVTLSPTISSSGLVFSVNGVSAPATVKQALDTFSPTICSTDEEDNTQGVLALCGGELCNINPSGTGGSIMDTLPDGFIKPVVCLGSSIINNSPVDKLYTTVYATPGPRYRYMHIPFSF